MDTEQAYVDTISTILSQLGAVAVTCRNAAETPIFEPSPDERPIWKNTTVSGMFAETADLDRILLVLQAQCHDMLPRGIRLSKLPDSDWQRVWMEYFQPLRFAGGVWIVPSWHEPPDLQETVIRLDPGMAFGTGTHPTTAICIEWLAQSKLNGLCVVDYGCGSGILSLVAAKLGASEVVAVDHDSQALRTTRNNAKNNDVERIVATVVPDKMNKLRGKIDIIVANILADPLLSLAPSFAELLPTNGVLAISGILEAQQQNLRQRYARWFTLDTVREQEGWILLAGRRR